MATKDWDDMSEDEQTAEQKRENRAIRRSSRSLRTALLDKLAKDKDSDEFPNLDGSSKQVYAITTVLDGLDRDVQESEKALAAKESAGDTGALVTAVFEALIERGGDPTGHFAKGERGERTVGDDRRLRPDNKATDQHMRIGNEHIEFEDVFHKKD